MDIRSEFKITSINDFRKVSRENEVFFWNFIVDDQNSYRYHIQALSQPLILYRQEDPLVHLIETFGIKIFESYTKDSIEFLLELGYPSERIFHKGAFMPNFVGFRNHKFMYGTNHNVSCFCRDGVLDVMFQTYPELLNHPSILGVEKENLE